MLPAGQINSCDAARRRVARTVTLTVNLPSNAATRPLERPFSGGALPIALDLILLPIMGRLTRGSRRQMGLVLVAAGLSGCGGGGGGGSNSASTPQTYMLTVMATSGSLSHSTTLTLTVEQGRWQCSRPVRKQASQARSKGREESCGGRPPAELPPRSTSMSICTPAEFRRAPTKGSLGNWL